MDLSTSKTSPAVTGALVLAATTTVTALVAYRYAADTAARSMSRPRSKPRSSAPPDRRPHSKSRRRRYERVGAGVSPALASADLPSFLRPWREWREDLMSALQDLQFKTHQLHRRRRRRPDSPAPETPASAVPVSPSTPSKDEDTETIPATARRILHADPGLRRALRGLEARTHAVPGLRACAADLDIDWARVFLLERDPLPAAVLWAAAVARDEGGRRGSDVPVRVNMGPLLDVCFGGLLGQVHRGSAGGRVRGGDTGSRPFD